MDIPGHVQAEVIETSGHMGNMVIQVGDVAIEGVKEA